MTGSANNSGHVLDTGRLPPNFPTHLHTPNFWEALGRTVATFGFLEEILGRAIFALTATQPCDPTSFEAAYPKWLVRLEKALTDQLVNLADSYGEAAKGNPNVITAKIDDLVDAIKKAAVIRNVLCHGSWKAPNSDGACIPFFVNRQLEVFETQIDVDYLRNVQTHVSELACHVINTITSMGLQFPGANGPGKPIV